MMNNSNRQQFKLDFSQIFMVVENLNIIVDLTMLCFQLAILNTFSLVLVARRHKFHFFKTHALSKEDYARLNGYFFIYGLLSMFALAALWIEFVNSIFFGLIATLVILTSVLSIQIIAKNQLKKITFMMWFPDVRFKNPLFNILTPFSILMIMLLLVVISMLL